MDSLGSKLFLFLFFLIHGMFSQTEKCVEAINNSINTIPFVFEGKVESVEIYAGDDFGNKLPKSSARWKDDAAYFYDSLGKPAHGYSSAKIKICKVYKGEFKKKTKTIIILAKGGVLNSIYLVKNGKDTTLSYLINSTKHNDEENKIILPSSEYFSKIYFCNKIEPVDKKKYADNNYYTNFNSLFEFSFGEIINVKQPDGSILQQKAYVIACNESLKNEVELTVFLKRIKTLKAKPKNFCK